MIDKILIPLDEDLKEICREVLEKSYSGDEWKNIESDDMFQKGVFVGGFDATENAFTFSYFHGIREYWFQLTFAELMSIQNETL